MKSIFLRKAVLLLFVAGMFCLFFRAADRYIGWSSHEKTPGLMLHADGAGYYAYLPNWFIYPGKGFEFIHTIQKRYPRERFHDELSWNAKKKLGAKFYPGTAIVLSPFFLAGNLHAKLADEPQDGYSWPYLFWLTIGTAFYAAAGLLGLLQTGFKLGFSAFSVWVTTLLIGVGTNYYFYASGEMPMAHIFSFTLNIWSIYCLLKWKQNGRASGKILFFSLIALAIVVRPLNVLVFVMVPFLFDNFPAFLARLKQAFTTELRSTSVAAAFFLLIISIQVYNVWQQLDYVGFNLYTAEGFDNWKDPFFWHSLFGFEKGLFVYSPALLLMIPGLIAGLVWRRYLTIGILLFFLVSVYACSAWWCWGYGGSFGLRALVDFYGIYALAVMLLLSHVNGWKKWLMLLPILGAIYCYQVFDYQFRHNIIRYDGMNFDRLKLVFLKTDKRFYYIFERRLDTLGNNFHIQGEIPRMIHPETRKHIDAFYFNRIDFPYVTLNRSAFGNLTGDFAYRMQTDVRLDNPDSYTSMRTWGYSGGHEVFYFDNIYAHLPSKAGKWERISVDVNTQYPVSALDSVLCQFYATGAPSHIRKPVIYWGVVNGK